MSFEIPSSNSDYDEECPTEEKSIFEEEETPEIAYINLLTKESKHKKKTTQI